MSVAIAAKQRGKRNEMLREALITLAQHRGGHLSPEAVLDAARDEASPLHSAFEWDDSAAAEAFRLVQARGLIREVKIRVVTESKDPTRVNIVITRAFPSLPSLRGSKDGSYIAAANITEANTTELVNEVLVQLERLRQKHAALTSLAGVWRAIDEAGSKR